MYGGVEMMGGWGLLVAVALPFLGIVAIAVTVWFVDALFSVPDAESDTPTADQAKGAKDKDWPRAA